jgi:hypothetical protein
MNTDGLHRYNFTLLFPRTVVENKNRAGVYFLCLAILTRYLLAKTMVMHIISLSFPDYFCVDSNFKC